MWTSGKACHSRDSKWLILLVELLGKNINEIKGLYLGHSYVVRVKRKRHLFIKKRIIFVLDRLVKIRGLFG